MRELPAAVPRDKVKAVHFFKSVITADHLSSFSEFFFKVL